MKLTVEEVIGIEETEVEGTKQVNGSLCVISAIT